MSAAWTRRQLQDAMRRDGWERIGPGWYEHTVTGKQFDFDTCYRPDGIPVWQAWAERQEVPPK